MTDFKIILEDFINGDSDCFSLIVDEYQQRIFKYAYHMLKDYQESEDATQEVFLKVYYKINTLKDADSFNSWIYKLAYYHCVNKLKKRKLLSITSFFTNDDLHQLKSINATTFEDTLSYELEKALSKLSVDEKNLVFLRIIEDLSYDEISRITGHKTATLRKKFERARGKLKKMIDLEKGLDNYEFKY